MKDEESSRPSANAGQSGADGAGSRGGGFGGGNRFAWHQDFAYWTEGNPYNRPVMPSPDVATAAVAIDRAGSENGAGRSFAPTTTGPTLSATVRTPSTCTPGPVTR